MNGRDRGETDLWSVLLYSREQIEGMIKAAPRGIYGSPALYTDLLNALKYGHQEDHV